MQEPQADGWMHECKYALENMQKEMCMWYDVEQELHWHAWCINDVPQIWYTSCW